MSARPVVSSRITVLTALIAVLFVALTSRLWFVQVLASESYALRAEDNRVQLVSIEPPRGRILAADGRELVTNRPGRAISVDTRVVLDSAGAPRDAAAAAMLDRLAALLGSTREALLEELTRAKHSPFRPVPVAEDVTPELLFAVREHRELFPGVIDETLPVRTYPEGGVAAHLLGYLGEIGERELASPVFDGYRPGETIGRAGVERSYERWLQGDEGFRRLEVDAGGAVIRPLGVEPPTPGADLVTTIDLDLQHDVERLLADGLAEVRGVVRRDGRRIPAPAGAAVVLDPRDGSIVAMASFPSYDPARFVGGVDPEYWAHVNDVAAYKPLVNRALQETYPPGSVFKPISAAAYLEAGVVDVSERINCPSAWGLGGIVFRNWNSAGEGRMELSDALKRSCDTYFYELGHRLWQVEERREATGEPFDEMLPTVAARFGLGRALEVDLPGEARGVVPGRAWRQAFWRDNRGDYCRRADAAAPGSHARSVYADLCRDGGVWRGGDAVNASIGQGDVAVTPLQLAAAYAAIANGGTLLRPHVGRELRGPDGEVLETVESESLGGLGLDAHELSAIRFGLLKVVAAPGGTAAGAFRGFPLDDLPVAGKTGTAEHKPRVPYAWFGAFAPADDPRYVVVVAAEEGGGGSQTAAPIARRILESAFDLPITPYPSQAS